VGEKEPPYGSSLQLSKGELSAFVAFNSFHCLKMSSGERSSGFGEEGSCSAALFLGLVITVGKGEEK
jgi:hypothetical protein